MSNYDDAMKRVKALLPRYMQPSMDKFESVTHVIFSAMYKALIEPLEERLSDLERGVDSE